MSRPRRFPVALPQPAPEYTPRQFIADHATVSDDHETVNAEVYAVYVDAAQERGMEAASHRRLSLALKEAGFRQAVSRVDGRVWSRLLLLNI